MHFLPLNSEIVHRLQRDDAAMYCEGHASPGHATAASMFIILGCVLSKSSYTYSEDEEHARFPVSWLCVGPADV